MIKQEEQQQAPLPSSPLHSPDLPVLVASVPVPSPSSSPAPTPPPPLISEIVHPLPPLPPDSITIKEKCEDIEQPADVVSHTPALTPTPPVSSPQEAPYTEESPRQQTFCKSFVCNVCEAPFPSIKEMSRHITVHSEDWPFKCEFCVQLFRDANVLLEHRSTLHGVGRIYVCSLCSKEFAFLCNLQQHQRDQHPDKDCTHIELDSGKLRPQNYTDPSRASLEPPIPSAGDCDASAQGATPPQARLSFENRKVKEEEDEEEEPNDSSEELYTTIKIMASGESKPKGPDVRLGINQHYPSFKPPPFPYHNRTPAGSVASATNFTTHNIPQTFSTAIRCTKCGNSFDNMPELHKHILACASASDKKRYTPKKNPVPLKQIVKPQNGVFSAAAGGNGSGQNAFRRMGQPKRLNFSQEPSNKMKLNALNKKKNQLVQKAIYQKNKSAATAKKASSLAQEEPETHVCPHCSREFTYVGSLNKHVAVSCPLKPASSKKAKKGSSSGGGHSFQDKNGNLRRRTADSEIKLQGSQAKLGKTRARSSGPSSNMASPSKTQPSKLKTTAPQIRQKRPSSFHSSSVPDSKKSKTSPKGSPQQHPSPPAALGNGSQKLVMRMQKKVTEAKAQQQPQQQLQLKKEERFSVKMRERSGGPVTRSLQLASSTAPSDVKGEDVNANQESREPQEPLLKMSR